MPTKFTVKVSEKKNLTGNYWQIEIERPAEFSYSAGQFVSILVDQETGMRRSYSLASAPEEKNLKLVFDVTPMGIGSKFLLGLEAGSEIEILGPMGRFTVRPSLKHKAFLGTGSGIVPLRSMVHDLLERRKFKGRVELNWGMRFIEDAFWNEEFMELMKAYPNFHYDLVLSRPLPGWMGCRGHVQDCLLAHAKLDIEEWEAYICGSNKMAEDVENKLVEQGMRRESVSRENFG